MADQADSRAETEPVVLPPNVSIYTGQSATQLVSAKFFTRLTTTARDAPMLTGLLGPEFSGFCLQHHKIILIFTNELDLHHDQFRQVCLLLKDHDLGVEYGGCVFDAESALQAGFQLDPLDTMPGVLVVDLQHQDDDDDEDEDDEENEDDNEDENNKSDDPSSGKAGNDVSAAASKHVTS